MTKGWLNLVIFRENQLSFSQKGQNLQNFPFRNWPTPPLPLVRKHWNTFLKNFKLLYILIR